MATILENIARIARYQQSIRSSLFFMLLPNGELPRLQLLSDRFKSPPETWMLIRDLLEVTDADENLVNIIGYRRCYWSVKRFQRWLRRMINHYDGIISGDHGKVDYLRVAGVEIIDGLDHYGFEPTVEQEKKLIFAALAFDPNVFKTRIATDCRASAEDGVYTVLYETEIIRLVLNAEWDALHHADLLAQNSQLASVTHFKELLRTGNSRSLAAGVL